MTISTAIPVRRDTPDTLPSEGLAHSAGAVLLALLAVAAVWLWIRRRGAAVLPASTGPLRTVRSTRLTPHHSLHVVEWEGRRLLVGCAEHAIALLAETPAPGVGSVADPRPAPEAAP